MNQTSAVVTGGVAISTATLMPAVEWALGIAFHVPVPPSVSSLVSGLVVAGAHYALNYLAGRNKAKQLSLPAGTKVTYDPPVPVLNTAATVQQ